MRVLLALVCLIGATAGIASAQTAGTLTGKIVDIATYVTKDHNMDSMKAGDHGASGAMPSDHGASDTMSSDHGSSGSTARDHAMSRSMSGDHAMGHAEECHMVGLLANATITLLSTQMGSSTGAALCARLNKTATITGKSYSQAGITVFLVDSIK